MRVAAIQMAHGTTLEDNLARARAHLERAAEGGARIALLPEYWFATFGGPPNSAAPDASRIRAMLSQASKDLGIAVAGNVIDRMGSPVENVGVVYEAGAIALEQPKVHPMPREAASGIVGGDAFRSARVAGHSAGMLVCADILFPEAARIMGLRGTDVLLNPVMSPFRDLDEGKEARVAMYVARAYDAQAFVVKAAGFKRPVPTATPPFGIAGRSLITAPWGVLARYRDEFEEEILYADLDISKLSKFREGQSQFPARRPDAYRELV